MKCRKKPSLSCLEKSKNEIENEAKLLEERIKQVKEIRHIEAYIDGYESGYEEGFSKACEMLHDFAKTVYEMRKRQRAVERAMTECDDYSELTILVNSAEDWEAEVDAWIGMNYPHLMEDRL